MGWAKDIVDKLIRLFSSSCSFVFSKSVEALGLDLELRTGCGALLGSTQCQTETRVRHRLGRLQSETGRMIFKGKTFSQQRIRQETPQSGKNRPSLFQNPYPVLLFSRTRRTRRPASFINIIIYKIVIDRWTVSSSACALRTKKKRREGGGILPYMVS